MLLLLAIMFLFAIATGAGVLYRMSYFLTLVMVSSYVYLWLRLRGLEMWMNDKSYVVQVGDVLKLNVSLRNESRLKTGWFEIRLVGSMPGDVSGIATAVSARGQDQVEMHTFCGARGVYTLGPLLARTNDPLGLFRREIVQGNAVKVTVQPAIVRLPCFKLPVSEQSGEESVQYRSQTRTPHVASVREYIRGDNVNQIHWLSTAKIGQLMSKEFDSAGSGDVWVVLDLEEKVHHTQGMESTDEYAVAIATSLVYLALGDERSVGLITYGDHEYILPMGGGTGQMSTILETLTLCKTEGHQPLAKVLMRSIGQFGKSASLLIVTSSTAIEWISILREVRNRGLNTVVVLVDPVSFGGEQSLDGVVMALLNTGTPAYMVRKGDSLPDALSRPIMADYLPVSEEIGKSGRPVASGV
jgi:uncharacterized protein (DUF58 family)